MTLRRMQQIEVRFGQAVRRRREMNGVSQEAFAQMAGVHRTYISSIERGKVQVGIGVAEKLAEALETPLSELIRDAENIETE